MESEEEPVVDFYPFYGLHASFKEAACDAPGATYCWWEFFIVNFQAECPGPSPNKVNLLNQLW